MRVRYAYKNLVRARARLGISLVAISFAAFLMAAQGSLLYGFTMAASRIVDSIDADVWIVAPDIPAFDFVSPIEERIAWLARGVAGVKDTGRGLGGHTAFEKPNGERTTVFVVAVERSFEGRMPRVKLKAAEVHGLDSNIAADETDRATLGGRTLPARVQVGGSRAHLAFTIRDFSSFVGSPMVFADIADSRRFLLYPEERISFVTLKLHPDAKARAVKAALQSRFPNVSVFTRREFSWRSRTFWLTKTGAGAALSLAAALGFLIGLSVVAQTIYSLSADSVEEYAMLKAMGADNGYVRSIVLTQSLICGVAGGAIGLSLVGPFSSAVRPMVSWIAVPSWMYLLVVVILALLSISAGLIAARPATSAEPARVFRA
jgi:putative ABC transport system permease protein